MDKADHPQSSSIAHVKAKTEDALQTPIKAQHFGKAELIGQNEKCTKDKSQTGSALNRIWVYLPKEALSVN